MINITRIKSEIIRRLDKLLSQYLYDYDININDGVDYVLTVNIDTNLDSLTDREINSLVGHIAKLANDYNMYDLMSDVTVYDDEGFMFKIYL